MPKAVAVSRSHWVARMTRPMRVRVSRSQTRGEDQRRGGDRPRACSRSSRSPGSCSRRLERRGDRAGLGAEEGERGLLEDVEQPDGGDDGRLGVVVEALQHQPVGGDGDRADDERADDERGGEAERRRAGHRVGDEPGDDGAEHEELAVGDVDDAHDAEDEAEAGGGQRQHRGGDQALEGREQQERAEPQGRLRSSWSCSRPRPGRGRPRSRWCARRRACRPRPWRSTGGRRPGGSCR